jgi:hypothetical protein
MENPCNDMDIELFHALTKVSIGDGITTCFWNDPWAGGISPKWIAPSIFSLSKRKKYNVSKATTNEAWILQIDTSAGLSVQKLQEFTNL